MTKLKILSVACLAILISACGSSSKKGFVEAPPCVYPDAPDQAAPGWICDEPVEAFEVTAVGSADKSAAGHDFMKQIAAASARVQLAQSMRTQVTNLVKLYAETTGTADAETVDKVNTSVTKQITDETLVGTRIVRTITSPTGSLYVLIGVDQAAFANITQTALKTSMNNDAALWQQFKAEKAQDELAADIAGLRQTQ